MPESRTLFQRVTPFIWIVVLVVTVGFVAVMHVLDSKALSASSGQTFTIQEGQRGLVFGADNTVTTVLEPGQSYNDSLVYVTREVSAYEGWLPATVADGETIYPIEGQFRWEISFDAAVARYNALVISGEPFAGPEAVDLENHEQIARYFQSIIYADVVNRVLDAQAAGTMPMPEYVLDDPAEAHSTASCWEVVVRPTNLDQVSAAVRSLVGDTITNLDAPKFDLSQGVYSCTQTA